MATVNESETWEDGVYRLELLDFVTGGEEGVDNKPHKQLANRTQWLKKRVDDMLLNSSEDMNSFKEVEDALNGLGGFKNLWIDGAMQIWDDGESGEFTESFDRRYLFGLMIGGHHTRYDENGVAYGVGGTTYRWEREYSLAKNWMKMIHVSAMGNNVIGQRYAPEVLQYLKGKTVTLSFLYKSTITMKGMFRVYTDQHGTEGVPLSDEVLFDYIGDGAIHKIELTVELSTDNILPEDNDHISFYIHYGGVNAWHEPIPDGSISFTEFQLECNLKSTNFEHIPISIERIRMGYYYQVHTKILGIPYVTNRLGFILPLIPMRVKPSLTYLTPNPVVADESTNSAIMIKTESSSTSYYIIENMICDARMY